MLTPQVNNVWMLLRITYGVIPIIVGIDKYFNLLTYWEGYLSPLVVDLLPVSGHTFMTAIGVLEVIAGIAILTKWTKYGAYFITLYLVGVSLNLMSTGGLYDIAMRDLAMAVGSYCLAKLTEAKEGPVNRV
jgi:hypothetical protein